MKCPYCSADTSVIDSRARNGYVYRRRECPNEHRFSTIETLIVRQRGGRRR